MTCVLKMSNLLVDDQFLGCPNGQKGDSPLRRPPSTAECELFAPESWGTPAPTRRHACCLLIEKHIHKGGHHNGCCNMRMLAALGNRKKKHNKGTFEG
jgi:hypothetical protein